MGMILMLTLVGMASASCQITKYITGSYNGAASGADEVNGSVANITVTFLGATQHSCTGSDWCATAQNTSTWTIMYNTSWRFASTNEYYVNVTKISVEKCNSSWFNNTDRVNLWNGSNNVMTAATAIADFDADGIYEYNFTIPGAGAGFIIYPNQSRNNTIVVQMYAKNPWNTSKTTHTGAGQYDVDVTATQGNDLGCNITQTYMNITLDDAAYESDLSVRVYNNITGVYADITPLSANESCNMPYFTGNGNVTTTKIEADYYKVCFNNSDNDKVYDVVNIYIPSYNGGRLFKISGLPVGESGVAYHIGPTQPTLPGATTTQPIYRTNPIVYPQGQAAVGTGLMDTTVTVGGLPSIPLPAIIVIIIIAVLALAVWKSN